VGAKRRRFRGLAVGGLEPEQESSHSVLLSRLEPDGRARAVHRLAAAAGVTPQRIQQIAKEADGG
jgi:hypothetical protein